MNLVDNAVKFTAPGGSVRVAARPVAEWLTISVSDTGGGISEEDLPRIRGKFYKANSKKPGSGLGLSIVDEIVRLHGGRLTIASELGRGTTVTVWLPVGPPSREPSANREVG
ncbi:MAG: sensor histidine kinase [Bacillota bacterium]